MSLLSSLRAATEPSAALEVTATHVSGIRLDGRRHPAGIAAHAVEPLAPGALVASLTGTNLVDQPVVSAAFGRVMERLGRPARIALVVPDPVAKVSVLTFEKIPARAEDVEQLVRWQMRKTAPFPIEEAQVSYVAGQKKADGQDLVVSIARREVIAEYEQLAAAAGTHAGLVDLATFNVVNAVLLETSTPAPDDDWLLVHVTAAYATLVVVRASQIVLFRTRGTDTDSSLADLVHQTTMYYEDRLHGAGFGRVVLAGLGQGGQLDAARRSLQERLTTPVDSLNLSNVVTLSDRIAGAAGALAMLAPLVGVLLRGQEVAA